MELKGCNEHGSIVGATGLLASLQRAGVLVTKVDEEGKQDVDS